MNRIVLLLKLLFVMFFLLSLKTQLKAGRPVKKVISDYFHIYANSYVFFSFPLFHEATKGKNQTILDSKAASVNENVCRKSLKRCTSISLF